MQHFPQRNWILFHWWWDVRHRTRHWLHLHVCSFVPSHSSCAVKSVQGYVGPLYRHQMTDIWRLERERCNCGIQMGQCLNDYFVLDGEQPPSRQGWKTRRLRFATHERSSIIEGFEPKMLHIHWKVRAALNPSVSISQMTQAWQTHLFCDSADFGFTFKPAVIFWCCQCLLIYLAPTWALCSNLGGWNLTVLQGCGLCVLFKETKTAKSWQASAASLKTLLEASITALQWIRGIQEK